MPRVDERWCNGCDGPQRVADLCHQMLNADGLPARCVGEWSQDKLFYMRRFADIFTTGMKNNWPNRVYLDLFSGPGRCRVRPLGSLEDGSPLIALRYPFTHFHFCDLSADVTGALERRVQRVARQDQVWRVWTKDANAVATDLNRDVKQLGRGVLSFAFIDPTGTEMVFESVRTLTAGLAMDLLINFPLGMNIKRQFHHRLADPVGESRLDAYFGTPEWRDAEKRSEGPGVALLELYKNQLRTLGYKFVGDSRTIRHRHLRVPFYVLVFASKHERGEEFWNRISQDEPTGQRSLF